MQNDDLNKTCDMTATVTPQAHRFVQPRPPFTSPCHDPAIMRCERCGRHLCRNHEHPLKHGCKERK